MEIGSIDLGCELFWSSQPFKMNVQDALEDVLDKLYTHQEIVSKRSDKLDNVIEAINEFLDESDEEPSQQEG
jgi:hypothetical protein